MSLAIGERAYGDGEQYGGQYGEQYGEHEHMESNLESNLERACGAGICDMEFGEQSGLFGVVPLVPWSLQTHRGRCPFPPPPSTVGSRVAWARG